MLKLLTVILAPIFATLLSLISKTAMLAYFEVETDAGDRLFTMVETPVLLISYILLFGLFYMLFRKKKSLGFSLVTSQITYLVITTLVHLYIYQGSFYTIGKAA